MILFMLLLMIVIWSTKVMVSLYGLGQLVIEVWTASGQEQAVSRLPHA